MTEQMISLALVANLFLAPLEIAPSAPIRLETEVQEIDTRDAYASISGGSYISGSNWYSWTNAVVKVISNNYTVQFTASFSGSLYDAQIHSVGNYSIVNATVVSPPSIQVAHVYSGEAVASMSFIYNGLQKTLSLHVPAGSNSPYAVLQ